MSHRPLAALAAALTVPLVIGAPGAPAASANDVDMEVQVISPAPGMVTHTGLTKVALALEGWSGTYTVTVSGPECAASDWYEYEDSATFTHRDGNGAVRRDLSLDVMECAGVYDVTVERADQEWYTASRRETSFRLTTRPAITSLKASRKEFWPRVKDGYKDTTRMTWKVAGVSRTKLEVLDSRKRVVATSRWSTTRRSWTWDGRTRTGKKAGAGTYRARLTAEDGRGWRRTTTARITLRSGQRTVKSYVFRDAADHSRSHATGWCLSVTSDWLSVSCRSGVSATYEYDMRVPSGAHTIRAELWKGKKDGASVRTRVRKVSATKQRVSVIVSGGGYFFEGVKLKYATSRKY